MSLTMILKLHKISCEDCKKNVKPFWLLDKVSLAFAVINTPFWLYLALENWNAHLTNASKYCDLPAESRKKKINLSTFVFCVYIFHRSSNFSIILVVGVQISFHFYFNKKISILCECLSEGGSSFDLTLINFTFLF